MSKQKTTANQRKGQDNIKGQGFHTNPERINKQGRPKKLPALDLILAEVLGKESKGKSDAQRIIEAIKTRALRGDVRAAESLLDRGYGKVKEVTEVAGNITINVRRRD
jgi:hypothetical protein